MSLSERHARDSLLPSMLSSLMLHPAVSLCVSPVCPPCSFHWLVQLLALLYDANAVALISP